MKHLRNNSCQLCRIFCEQNHLNSINGQETILQIIYHPYFKLNQYVPNFNPNNNNITASKFCIVKL